MKMVVGKFVLKNQCAFLAGGRIIDCNLLAHELVRDFKKKIGATACLKVDLIRLLTRDFVCFIMQRMGFPHTRFVWIREC